MYLRLVQGDTVRVASLVRAGVVALAMMLAVVTPVEGAFAGGASRPPYAASVAPAVVFAGDDVPWRRQDVRSARSQQPSSSSQER